MTFWSFLVVLTGAATLSTQMMRLVYWLDHPTRRGRRAAAR
ncbi:MAG: hypothetical protein ACI3WR_05215 [Oscillospiraceae bacterium]